MRSRPVPANTDPPGGGGRRTTVAVAFIVALVLGAYWKLTLMRGVVITDDIFASDLMNENFPYRFALGNALHSGEWPFWVREIYGGFPLLARSEAGVCYPFNIVLFGLLSPYVALNLTILLTIVTAGVGMYFYAREIAGSLFAGVVGGVAFAFSGYLISHLKHLSMANAACWLPVAMTLLERAIKRNTSRPLLWFGLVFALQNLSGNAQIAYYCGGLYVLYFGFRLLNQTRAADTGSRVSTRVLEVVKNRLIWAFAGILLLGALMAAVQLVPTYELVSLSQRAGGVTFEYASNYAYDPRSFWTFLYPYANGDIGNLTYTGKGIFWEDYGYVGLVTLLLAVYAPLGSWSNWHVKFFSFAAVSSYVLVMGPATPIYKLVFTAVPGMSYFRFPTRLLLVTDFSLIALASLGLTRLTGRLFPNGGSTDPLGLRGSRRSVLTQAMVVAVVTGDLLHFQRRQNPIADAAEWMDPPQVAKTLNQDPSLFRMFGVGVNHAHRRTFQQARGWEGDLRPFVEQREFIQPSSNVLYGISSPAGYANLIPNYLVDVWGDQNRPGIITRTASTEGGVFRPTQTFWKLMRMYNVKYLTSFWPFAPAPHLTALGVFGDAHLYRNDDFLPRAYLVANVTVVPDGQAALDLLRSDGFDPVHSAILNVDPPDYRPAGPTDGDVAFVRYTTGEAEMRVRASKNAILVFSDSYYPGWVADIDGIDAPIYRANVTQRAIVVPAGEHRVRFRFKPVKVLVGFWISVAALIVLVSCWLIPLIRPRAFPGPASGRA